MKNPSVLMDQRWLAYRWTVTGAAALRVDQPVLTIPMLPPAVSHVAILVQLTKASGLRAVGFYEFTTVEQRTDLSEEIRQFD